MSRIEAVVFDFDGTIIDTETPVYESWRSAYESAGVEPIPFETWRDQIGMADGDALDVRAHLSQGLGTATVPSELEELRETVLRDMMLAEPVRDGVLTWLDECDQRSVPLAIGSSSPTEWVHSNLVRVGLRDRFRLLSCADPGIPGKPDPTVYLEACRGLGIDPANALAIEDSPNGTRAAIAAGMRCIAAPGPITAGSDFSHATLAVASLADANPADWL